MAEHGHYGGRPGQTRQGIYVCSPNGKFLASINSNSAERVLRMMEEGLAAWKELPEEERKLADDSEIQPRHRWEDSYPEDGMVISVITRDLPESCDPNEPCEVKWNRDFVWFTRDEARQWLGENPADGQQHQLPERLTARIVRFHLVDTVNGQSTEYDRNEVAGSKISTKITEIDGDSVRMEIVGTTQAGAEGNGRGESEHGVVSKVLGRATYDMQAGTFVEFEMVALGRRWGHTRFNARRRGPESGPLGYVFKLASPKSPRVAPAFIYAYNADWVKRPGR